MDSNTVGCFDTFTRSQPNPEHETLPLHFYPAPFYVIRPLERHVIGLQASHIVVVLRFINFFILASEHYVLPFHEPQCNSSEWVNGHRL